MKPFNLFIILMLSLQSLTAQETVEMNESPQPQFIIKFSPINLIDADVPGLSFSLEHQLRKDHYLHHEINLLTGMGHERFKGKPIFGYRLRTGYRHYYRELSEDGSNPFYEILMKFKQTFQKRITTFSRFNGAFGEDLPNRMRSTSVGIYGAYGRQYFLGSGFTLEWGFTLGWRFLQKQVLDVPQDAVLIENVFAIGPQEGLSSFPSTYLLFKIGYVLK